MRRGIREASMGREICASLILVAVFSVALFSHFRIDGSNDSISGLVIGNANEGCCEDLCTQSRKEGCRGEFHPGEACRGVERCLIGCCVDKEGYCLQNYLGGNCARKGGQFISKRCDDVLYCAYGSDKPLIQKNRTKNPQGEFAALIPLRGSHGSFIPLLFMVLQDADRVQAEIFQQGATIALIELYDDGRHSDGSADDGLYGNLWDSSTSEVEEGMSGLEVGIIVTSNGERRSVKGSQNITIRKSNACSPLDTKPLSGVDHIIISGRGYGQQTQHFRSDAQGLVKRFSNSVNFSKAIRGYGLFRFDRTIESDDADVIKGIVRGDCSFLGLKDTIFIMDRQEECREEDGIVWINPRFLLRASAINFSFSSFEGICEHVISEGRFLEEINRSITPPRIVFHTANLTFDGAFANISFSVIDRNYPVAFAASLDGSAFANGSVADDFPLMLEIPLSEPQHGLLIQATNARSIYSFAFVNITSPIINQSEEALSNGTG